MHLLGFGPGNGPFRPPHARLFSLRRTAKAQSALGEAIHLLSPNSAARAEVRYTLSRNHLRKHDRPAFESEARALLGESPGGKWAAKTRYLLARVSEDDLEYESASRFYQEIIERRIRIRDRA